MRTQFDRKFDHSGGVQSATNWLLRAGNEIEDTVNGRFDVKIGSIVRRNGYEQEGDTLESGKEGLGLYEAKFSTGSKFLAAINNSGDTATVIKHLTGSTWANLTLPSSVNDNTTMQFIDTLDEAYVAGMDDAGVRMSLLNIQNDLSVSNTRNLIGAPKARFIAEYGGSLYAMNVNLDSTDYPDRVYKSSPALSVITFTRGRQNVLTDMAVDSVRYLKAGMTIDIYNRVDGTKRYDSVTISSVDKGEDIITLPAVSGSETFGTGDVNTSTEVITLSDTTDYPTGTPVTITSTTTVPAPLVSGTVYYVINVSGTTIKLATTEDNATAGTAINLTSTGSGTHTANLLYVVGDNDEIYLEDRKGELCYLWNTDYPTEDKADFLKIPSGIASDSAIVGWAKSNDRLFFYTENSMHRWDRSRLITRYEDIGCSNHESIVNVGDWLLWLDMEGRVNAYNDATGQHEFISRAVKDKYLFDVPAANLRTAAAGKVDNTYKLCLGTIDGVVRRVCYDFDSNNWTRENHTRPMLHHIVSDESGYRKLYFLDDTGKLFKDDTGNLDDTATIPFSVTFGRDNSGTDKQKEYIGWYFFGENMSGLQVRTYSDGEADPVEFGKLSENISKVTVGNKNVSGRDISIEVSGNSKGDPQCIDGYVQYFSAVEDKFGF